jgi:hypothetical protein
MTDAFSNFVRYRLLLVRCAHPDNKLSGYLLYSRAFYPFADANEPRRTECDGYHCIRAPAA